MSLLHFPQLTLFLLATRFELLIKSLLELKLFLGVAVVNIVKLSLLLK